MRCHAVVGPLTSGELGAHNGLPAAVIASATIEDLQAKTRVARNSGFLARAAIYSGRARDPFQ